MSTRPQGRLDGISSSRYRAPLLHAPRTNGPRKSPGPKAVVEHLHAPAALQPNLALRDRLQHRY